MTMENDKEFCDECNQYNYLYVTEACADMDCCYKKICIDGCSYTCNKCYNIYHNSEHMFVKYDGIDRNYICYKCIDLKVDTDYKKAFIWNGISLEEHMKRYGY